MSIMDTTLAETEILLAQPRGFCAGVDRAIEIVERAIKLYGAPIYVRHEIVHNAYVVEDLRKKGAIFIEQLDEVPAVKCPCGFSRRGFVSPDNPVATIHMVDASATE